ncbi:MAG: hypothetical protein GY909_09780 [Oligoflexia bacterium]|nr:hypothetical protein [Oligoflexia bacterium]
MKSLLFFIRKIYPETMYHEVRKQCSSELNSLSQDVEELSYRDIKKWINTPIDYLSDNDRIKVSYVLFKEALMLEVDSKQSFKRAVQALEYLDDVSKDLYALQVCYALRSSLYLFLALNGQRKSQRKFILLATSSLDEISSPSFENFKEAQRGICYWSLNEPERVITIFQKACKKGNMIKNGNLILSKIFAFRGHDSASQFYYQRYMNAS